MMCHFTASHDKKVCKCWSILIYDNDEREMQRASLAFMVVGAWWVTKSQLGGESGLANDLEGAKREGVFVRGDPIMIGANVSLRDIMIYL